jgi:hypothetical protein
VRLEVCRGVVEDVEPVALELDTLRCVRIYTGEPRRIEDLYEGTDGIRL